MYTKHASLMGFALALLFPAFAAAQQQPQTQAAIPAPGCGATLARLEANKKLVIEFFSRTDAGRVALADRSYKQHNPAFKKRAEDARISDYDEFKNFFTQAAANGGAAGGSSTGPQPPQGNPFEIVMAECDLVTIIHKSYRQDPTAAPGKFYEVFTFDTLRVRNGKFVEHWDGALINPPAPVAANR